MKPSPRLRLVEARKDRRWSQQEVADRLGTTQHTVSRWERGATTPTAYFQAKLCALFGKSPQELGLVEQAPPSPDANVKACEEPAPTPPLVPEAVPTLWTMPYPRNPFFLGRDEELAHIRSDLEAGNALALSQPQAISGLGGIGKTQLALEYAYRYAQDYQAVLWAHAESTETLIASYVTFAAFLRLPEQGAKEQEVIVQAVKRWLSTHQGWLLILDNADELSILPEFLPPMSGGHVLITTRAQATGRLASRIQIEIFSPEQGAFLLLRRSGLLPPDVELSQAQPEEQALASQISEELGGLPLALDQAGAYLEETGIALEDYWRLYQQNRTALLQRRGGLVADHPLSVAATWLVSFQRLEASNPAAADLLRLLVWLPADAVAEELLIAGTAFLGPVLALLTANAMHLNEAIEVLRAYSLLRRDPKMRMLSMHRLVQAVLQDQQELGERQTWAERVVRAVTAAFPNVSYETWAQCERLLPLALSAAEHIEKWQMAFEEAEQLLAETAAYLKARARYKEAASLFEQALCLRGQRLGSEHPEIASLLNGLAELFLEQGKYHEAECLFQRAVHLWECAWGPEHLEVGTSCYGLAGLCWRQGRYAEAESLYQRTLRIWEQCLGPEHPEVARPLAGLANVYYEQGKYTYAQAQSFYQRALSILERHLGPEHPEVAYVLNGLALLSYEQYNYAEAEALFQRVLQIWEQSLGPEHPEIASPLCGLACLYREQGRHVEAEQLYQRALRIREQRLGPEHPQVAHALRGLAQLYYEQRRYTEAEQLYRQALSIIEQHLDPEHPSFGYTLDGLAVLYQAQGRYAEAEPLFRRELAIWEHLHGTEHPLVASPLRGLAYLFRKQGKYAQAERLYRRALRIREQAWGSHHPETAEIFEDLAQLCEIRGNHEGPETGGCESLRRLAQGL